MGGRELQAPGSGAGWASYLGQLCRSVVRLCRTQLNQKARVAKEEPSATPEKPATVKPLSPARYKVAFTASEELRDKLERLQALMPGGDLASIIDAAVSDKLERLEAKRYGKTNKPRKKPRRRRHLTGRARHLRRGETRRVGARSGSMYLHRRPGQTLPGAPPARVPPRRALRVRWRSKRGQRTTGVFRLTTPTWLSLITARRKWTGTGARPRESANLSPRSSSAGTKSPKTPPSHDSHEPGAPPVAHRPRIELLLRRAPWLNSTGFLPVPANDFVGILQGQVYLSPL